ncbi:manganese catalase family protein [Azospirillum thermophilum]|uniref:Mn-containing catalase n=1 Tax=Azospirillum thermophilum TaxID=2202148 RepID=A0A2S2CMT2_9PROT|nr:manganese catalase family protein [Azospirillum thermophilum]AWK85627.1 Mn-containing catalase [Azospirillum thermophilum]
MFMHNKNLMYTVRVSEPDPKLAALMLEQFGGPQGELAAAMRYFTQGIADEDPGRKDMLIDIATEELSHLEVIGSIVAMLTKGVKGKLAEAAEETTDLLANITQGNGSHTLSLLYGGGPALTNSAGQLWNAGYIDSIGEPTADLRSNIAAEARAKIIYERLINVTPDPGVKEALGFLMTREVAHQKMFEKALYSIDNNFPPGKMPGMPQYTDKYYNMSQGDGDARGPWNQGEQWEFVDVAFGQGPVSGGEGKPTVRLAAEELAAVEQTAARTKSRTDVNPVTGADLGAGPGAGKTTTTAGKV